MGGSFNTSYRRVGPATGRRRDTPSGPSPGLGAAPPSAGAVGPSCRLGESVKPPKTPRPILVTGSHRCGSTWGGRMIASPPRVGYVGEPFNAFNHRRCPVRHMWHFVTPQDEE